MSLDSPEVWMRNPNDYVRECVEVGANKIIWNYPFLKGRNIDPFKFMSLYYGATDWQSLVIKLDKVSHIDATHDLDDPFAVYPNWEYGEQINVLEDYMANPWGNRERMCKFGFKGESPILGQPHRVVVSNLPDLKTILAKRFIVLLGEMQQEYPDCIVHLHGAYSFRVLYGLNFRSGDYEARSLAQKGKIVLPIGKEAAYESTFMHPQWVHLLGYRPVDLRIPRNRCMFNIKSCFWAADHYKDAIKVETRDKSKATDPDDPLSGIPTSKNIHFSKVRTTSPGDKFLCNICTLQINCKYFRDGGVCIVPESEPVELARFFKTRDSDTIIEGLGTLLAAESRRLTKALDKEEETGSLDKETTRILNSLFDRGVKLAKLVDPTLAAAGAPKNVTQNSLTIQSSTPQALIAAVINEFVKRGIPRDKITDDMVMQVLSKPDEVKQRAIDVATAHE